MGLTFVGGAYNRAQGTREAFDALSDELVREGHPAMISLSGDREPEDQERIWYERMTLTPNGRKVYGYRWWQGKKWYQIHPDTVAPPRTSNHEARRSNDLKWPYNSDTTAARRAKVLARKYDITREGEGFGELWHWTHWGPLGRIDKPAAAGGTTTPEDDMTPEQASKLNAIHDAIFRGGNSMKDNKASISDSLSRIARDSASAADNTKPIIRDSGPVSVRQELANVSTRVAQLQASQSGLEAALTALANAKGLDASAILKAAQQGVENALRNVTFSVDVDG
ncbi:hypothetical protein AB0E56_13015 [Microbacterium sp. NPDC028030]|uniref:hypothetical protein n=1 Tax=Microbacterium sp. NPDC028030 TaxID=3155124 RepID=UPI0033C10C14